MKNETLYAPIVDENILCCEIMFNDPEDGITVGKRYIYKTTNNNLKDGDLVVVEARGWYAVVSFCEYVPVPINEENIKFRWVLEKVDTDRYSGLIRSEQDLIKKVNERRVAGSRNAVLAALGFTESEAQTLALTSQVIDQEET